ncbi:DDB1- and CUL4-associated factor 13 [Glycine max]|nr:DDB1- and CUL4-associated factor 13 [Glycine max]
MKVKVISRSVDEFTRERSQDLQRVFRNYDPSLRPQEKAVEYVRAVNAVKLDKIFARPFIGALDGHIDAVSCMTRNPSQLKGIFSSSMDGDIRLWDLAARRIVCQFPGHRGAVRGLTASTDGHILVSCGTDCTLWSVPLLLLWSQMTQLRALLRGADHQWDGEHFATAGAQVDIWNHNRSQPINSFEWGTDTVISVRFNPGEPNLLATSARMDVDYSPTGREFVTGSYDRTVRIFQYNGGHSKEIYHTKRMQRVFCVKFSGDGSYVISGSDDTNLRLWKAKASEQLGVILPRERKKHEYHEAIKKRYKHLPEVNRIARHRHLPRPIFKASALMCVMADAKRRKEEKRKAHSAPGISPFP